MAKRKQDAATPGCIVYCRVSSVGQAEEGVSLDTQAAACRNYAASRGWPVLAEFRDEGISGSKDETSRPGLASAIAATERHPGVVIVVYSLSRLSRSQRTTWRLLDDRGDYRLLVSSVTEPWDTSTAMGRAMLGMLAVWNQLEADLTSERTKAAMVTLRERGVKFGAASMTHSYGEGGYGLDQAKADLIRGVQLMARGDLAGLSLRQMCAELAARGITSVNGKAWHPRTLRKALALEL